MATLKSSCLKAKAAQKRKESNNERGVDEVSLDIIASPPRGEIEMHDNTVAYHLSIPTASYHRSYVFHS